jgi:hypothetical protein
LAAPAAPGALAGSEVVPKCCLTGRTLGERGHGRHFPGGGAGEHNRRDRPCETFSGRPFLIIYADKDYPFCGHSSEDFRKARKGKKLAAEARKVAGRNHLDVIGKTANDDDPCARTLLDFIADHVGR